MTHTEIYFKTWCPYSRRALRLLDRKGVNYTAIDVTDDVVRELEMRERAGRTSVPQIFIGDRHVGGGNLRPQPHCRIKARRHHDGSAGMDRRPPDQG